MSGLTHSTIEGFNRFVEEQRKEKGNTWLSLLLFSEVADVRYVAEPLESLPPLSFIEGPNTYRTTGVGTALYDAMGITIDGVSAWLANHPEFNGRVLICALTDGAENSSRQWTLNRVNSAIEAKQALGWSFLFLGTGQSAWLEGQKFAAIPQDHYVYSMATNAGTASTYGSSSMMASTLRSTGGMSATASTAGMADVLTPDQVAASLAGNTGTAAQPSVSWTNTAGGNPPSTPRKKGGGGSGGRTKR